MFDLHLVGNWSTTLHLDDRMACFFLLRRKLCIVSQVFTIFQLSTMHSVCPPSFALTIVVKYSWEVCIFPRAFRNNSLCKIWGANRVHYGELENREWGYYSRLPNEWVIGKNRCCFLFLIDANETQNFITKSNHSASTNVLLASFTAQATGFFTRKFCTTEAEHKNYDHKDTSLHVSLRTRNFDRKIHYCCKDSFFVKKDI